MYCWPMIVEFRYLLEHRSNLYKCKWLNDCLEAGIVKLAVPYLPERIQDKGHMEYTGGGNDVEPRAGWAFLRRHALWDQRDVHGDFMPSAPTASLYACLRLQFQRLIVLGKNRRQHTIRVSHKLQTPRFTASRSHQQTAQRREQRKISRPEGPDMRLHARPNCPSSWQDQFQINKRLQLPLPEKGASWCLIWGYLLKKRYVSRLPAIEPATSRFCAASQTARQPASQSPRDNCATAEQINKTDNKVNKQINKQTNK